MKDKYLHFGVCATIAVAVMVLCLLVGIGARIGALIAVAAAMSVAVAKEVYDSVQTANHFCWRDLGADLAGAIAGVAIVALVIMLSSCSAKRISSNTTENRSTVMERNDSLSLAIDHRSERSAWWTCIGWAVDSVSWSFHADSVVTPSGGILYRPTVEAQRVGTSATQQQATVQEAATDIATMENVDHATTAEDITTNTESDEQREPPGSTLVISCLRVAIITIIIVIALRLFNRNN